MRRGHVLEEVAVVAHHDGRRAARSARSSSSQRMPSRSRWLVGSSISRTSGSRRQLARDREALPPAAGQRADRRAAVGEPGAAEGLRRSVPVARPRPRRPATARDHLLDGAVQREDRILGHVAHADPAAEGRGCRGRAPRFPPGSGGGWTCRSHWVRRGPPDRRRRARTTGRRTASGRRTPWRSPDSPGAASGPSRLRLRAADVHARPDGRDRERSGQRTRISKIAGQSLPVTNSRRVAGS